MKDFIDEFKAFISRGNVMDMAVGIIIGGAFTSIISSFVEDIVNPFLGLFGGVNFDQLRLRIFRGCTINYGHFITNVLNFVIIAFVLFVVIKMMNTAASLTKKKEEEAAPTTKVCDFCFSEININAKRCPCCTSKLEDSANE